MKAKLLFLLLVVSLLSKAQTIEVSGTQSGIWDAETVVVTGDVTIQDSLTIKAGTTVLFKDYYRIIVSTKPDRPNWTIAASNTARLHWMLTKTVARCVSMIVMP